MNDQELKTGEGLKLPEPNYEIVFSADCEWKVKIHTETGRVEFAEGVDLDAASELFWTVLAGESPTALLKEIDDLKSQLVADEVPMVEDSSYERAMKVIE